MENRKELFAQMARDPRFLTIRQVARLTGWHRNLVQEALDQFPHLRSMDLPDHESRGVLIWLPGFQAFAEKRNERIREDREKRRGARSKPIDLSRLREVQ